MTCTCAENQLRIYPLPCPVHLVEAEIQKLPDHHKVELEFHSPFEMPLCEIVLIKSDADRDMYLVEIKRRDQWEIDNAKTRM